MEDKAFCVYSGSIGDEVVYVGMGSLDRPAHLNSGVSHLYEANRHHFNGGEVTIKILQKFPCKTSALDFEWKVIAEEEPTWNTAGTARNLIRNRIKKVTKSFVVKNTLSNLLVMAGDKIEANYLMNFTSADFRRYNNQDSVNNITIYMKNWMKRKGVHPFITNFYKTSSKSYCIEFSKDYIDNIASRSLKFTKEV